MPSSGDNGRRIGNGHLSHLAGSGTIASNSI